MEVTLWKRVGEVTTHFKRWGKYIESVWFNNPNTGNDEEYIRFGQPHWVEIIALTEEGQVLMIRLFKQGSESILDELPAGTLKDGDTPEQVAVRELLRETGYEAQEVISLRGFWMATRNSTTRIFGFVAKGCRKVAEPEQNPSDPIENFTMTLAEFIEFMQDRTENLSQAGITLAALKHLGIRLVLPE